MRDKLKPKGFAVLNTNSVGWKPRCAVRVGDIAKVKEIGEKDPKTMIALDNEAQFLVANMTFDEVMAEIARAQQ